MYSPTEIAPFTEPRPDTPPLSGMLKAHEQTPPIEMELKEMFSVFGAKHSPKSDTLTLRANLLRRSLINLMGLPKHEVDSMLSRSGLPREGFEGKLQVKFDTFLKMMLDSVWDELSMCQEA
jgi:hypothetical protein